MKHRKHGKKHGRKRSHNSPDGGFGKAAMKIVVVGASAIVAGLGIQKAVEYLWPGWSELVSDLVIGGTGLVVGIATAMIGSPGQTRQLIGAGLAAGPLTVAGVRGLSYAMAPAAIQGQIDASRASAAAAGLPLAANAYQGWGAMTGWDNRQLNAGGLPLSQNAYFGSERVGAS